MMVWPSRGGAAPEAPSAPESPLTYHEPDTQSLAERCAAVAVEWGTDKTASVAEPSALYRDPDAHPLVLMLMVLDRYGPASMEWDPEVLRATMIRDSYQVSGANWAKILAVRVLLASPSPWRQWEVFCWMARALAGFPPNFTYLEQPELGHLVVCVDLMKICDPTRETGLEVDKLVAATLRHEGHVFAPEPLAFAQRELEDPQLECAQCKALFTDNNDVRCITCGATALHKVPYVFATLRDECRKLWETRHALDFERATAGLGDRPADHLLYDLLVHWTYASHIRRQLLAQLRVLMK